MSEGWKRFLLQWILPVGVFGVVMVFLIASFNANIKQTASVEYSNNLVESTKGYANEIYYSVVRTGCVSKAVLKVMESDNIKASDSKDALTSIVDNSDAYMVAMTDSNGRAFLDTGEEVNLAGLDYFDTVYNCEGEQYHFVAKDGIIGNPAIILAFPVGNQEAKEMLFVYYPMNIANIRRLVEIDTSFDTSAYSLVISLDGTILVSTGSSVRYNVGSNVWDDMASSSNNSTIRRVKSKVAASNSGHFDIKLDGVDYLACYAPIPETNRMLMICYSRKSVDAGMSKLYDSSIRRLGFVGVAVVIFILIVSILNIIQIYISDKNDESLKDKADTDQLTGLKNKIATEREIKEYIEQYPDNLAMMFLIDIDNFKKINDTMGHAFGDEVLRELGRHIGINFRVSDVIGRTGGDEFMIFLKNLKEDANTLSEAKKLVYFFKHFQVGDYVKYTVTASIGAAVFPTHGTDFESLYKSADAAVYKSKKRGKNQLSFYDDRDRTPEEVAYADSHQISIERKEETPIES